MLYQTFLLVVNDRVGHFSLSLIPGISRSCSGRTFFRHVCLGFVLQFLEFSHAEKRVGVPWPNEGVIRC